MLILYFTYQQTSRSVRRAQGVQCWRLPVLVRWRAVSTDPLLDTSISVPLLSRELAETMCSVWPNMRCSTLCPSPPSCSPTGGTGMAIRGHREMSLEILPLMSERPSSCSRETHNLPPSLSLSRTNSAVASSSTVRTLTYTSWETAAGPVTHTVTALVTESVLVSSSTFFNDFVCECVYTEGRESPLWLFGDERGGAREPGRRWNRPTTLGETTSWGVSLSLKPHPNHTPSSPRTRP